MLLVILTLIQNLLGIMMESQLGVMTGTVALFMAVSSIFIVFEQQYKFELRLRKLTSLQSDIIIKEGCAKNG
jgi:uncharacterized membrane protein